jgi:hypothetical protein
LKVDEKRINKGTNKVEICTEIVYGRDGIIVTWEDYDTILLESTWGQCGHSDELYPLSAFRANSMRAQIEKEKIENQIKIRYAYIGSPTNMKEDPTYYESLRFKVLTIEQLEQRDIMTTLEDLITDGNEALIEVIGRDRCTGRVDMEGNAIYENDRIRCYADSGGYMDEIVDQKALWISTFCTKDCKVIGTKYEKKGIDK